jgi:DNA mismatch repair ATPase MutS
MKLEFEQNIIPDGLYKELGFDAFMRLFDLDIPLLPRRILRPLSAQKGREHFRILQDLQKQVDQKKLELEKIIDQSRKLPLLDFVLPFFENQSLEQFHLYSLGKFVSENLVLQEIEMGYPILPEPGKCCRKIKEILETHTQKSFSSLHYTPEEKELREKISKLEKELKIQLSQYENEIYGQTGLKMIYPYPKELPQDAENLPKIQDCKLLSVTSKQDINLVNYQLSPSIKTIISEKDTLAQKVSHLMGEKIRKINKELYPHFRDFRICYQERKNQTFYYVLLLVKQRQSLCLPTFQSSLGCKLTNAVLPSLQNQKKAKYIPLNLDLKRGANVLFGANMTGKTTVLKTIYFQLTAIRMGLPVCAESILLHFPEQVELHLKSAGNIRWNLSGFGQEIEFFTKEISPSAYILADELFQSTDPIGGVELSRIILQEFSHKDLVFFCTSHYPEVLSLRDISLYRMKDVDFDEETGHVLSLEDLMEKMPYKLERILSGDIGNAFQESKKPLYIALHFPLPESIKEKIRERLKG